MLKMGLLPFLIDTISYSYGNSEWGDLLTQYDGRSYSYDTIGNVTSDGSMSGTLGKANGKSRRGPNSELANAPDLDVQRAPDHSYNCYGNAIGKEIAKNPTGYMYGDSTQETFELVKEDIGKENVRELESIHDPIGEDEYMVALRCGPKDYHFIRSEGEKWYNKSGSLPGVYID